MRPFAFFDTRVRGFRVVEIGALVVLLALILTVYLAKTGAGGKKADIDHVQQQIFDEQTQIRMLRAEVATLEQPERLEDLSARYLHLGPISARHEVTAEGLADVAQVAVIDHKPTLIVSDPLTQVGSPDILPPDGAAAPPGGSSIATPAAVMPQPVAAPTAKPTAAQPALKLAQSGPPSHAAKLAAAHAGHSSTPPGLDATAQDGPDDAPVSDR